VNSVAERFRSIWNGDIAPPDYIESARLWTVTYNVFISFIPVLAKEVGATPISKLGLMKTDQYDFAPRPATLLDLITDGEIRSP
jgi:hypothetical protein